MSPLRTDFHAHALHPKIAAKAVAQLHAHYGIAPVGSGLLADLLAAEAAAGTQQVVIHCAATAPAQVIPANNWALSLVEQAADLAVSGDAAQAIRVVPFGTLHPAYADWERELDRLRTAGVKGLKFHPEFQGFRMDDPSLLPIMEAAQADFFFLFHVGDELPPAQNPSCPVKLAALLDAFPQARVIAAHLGGYLHWACALEQLAGRDVWLDTSSALPFIDEATLKAIVSKHPRERLLFGSDWPLGDPAVEAGLLRSRLGWAESEVLALMENGGRLVG